MRQIKRMFDPKNIFNPGKIFDCNHGLSPCARSRDESVDTARLLPHKIDNHLRENFTRTLELPFEPVLAFAFKDRSFIGNLEQCNGCGGCLKQTGIMCPTFMATHEEVMSTRGRANIIRAALELRVNGHDPLAFGGVGRRIEQLSLLQRVHTRMPIERESRRCSKQN